MGTLFITGDRDADELLNHDGLALLLGMLLDQQVPMTWAFRGPYQLRQRLGHLDAARIAAVATDDLVAPFVTKPALHRYPAVMARRAHALCSVVASEYDNDASSLWRGVRTGSALFGRIRSLPGFGDEKTQIFVALLAKRMGVAPPGWRAAAGVFADDEPRSVADASSPERLAEVQTWKQAMKTARRDKQGRPLA